MLELFKKLLMTRQIQFEKGDLRLLQQRIVMTPAATFVYMLKNSKDYWSTANLIYESCKMSTWKGFSEGLTKMFRLKPRELAKWLRDINELAGNGETTLESLDFEKLIGIVKVNNSPFIKLYGRSNNPIDHALRGYFAGGPSAAFQKNLDCVEISCQAMGDPFCKFIIMQKSELLKKFKSKIIRKQLGLYK